PAGLSKTSRVSVKKCAASIARSSGCPRPFGIFGNGILDSPMPNPPDPRLTTFQIELLKRVGPSPLGRSFFLTGGTALSACYLHHRLSEDLDFFTEVPGTVKQTAPMLESLVREAESTLRIARQFETFLEAFITSPQGETVKIDFAQDSPFRLGPVESSSYGVRVDNSLDIACNKLSALFERAAGKD